MGRLKIKQMEGIIESILFTMGDSVEVGKIAKAIEQDVDTTRKLIHRMMDKYESEDRGVRIIELEDHFRCARRKRRMISVRVATQPKKHALTDILLEDAFDHCL